MNKGFRYKHELSRCCAGFACAWLAAGMTLAVRSAETNNFKAGDANMPQGVGETFGKLPETNTIKDAVNIVKSTETNAARITEENTVKALGENTTKEAGATAVKGNLAGLKPSFDSFKLIYERNIFNQNRRPARTFRENPEPVKVVKTDRITLVGTVVTETNAVAFFDGSEFSLKGVVKLGQTIGGLKVETIVPGTITLSTGTNIFTLSMQSQIQRQDAGPWALVASAETYEKKDTLTKSGQESSSSNSSSDAGADEVLKRLMQKRDQEINK